MDAEGTAGMRAANLLTRLARGAVCLWPGLPRLWQGEWRSLLLSVGLAAAVNALLLLTFVLPHAVGGWLLVGWLLVGTGWIIGIWRTARRAAHAVEADARQEDLFLQAQAQYLRGHWFEAQAALEKLLSRQPRDVDAHLMLATLYRRTGRTREARRQLRILRRIDGAEKWELEIEQERRHAQRAPAAAGVRLATPPGDNAVGAGFRSDRRNAA